MRVQHGFSLIELMVCIAILAVMAGIGTPMMSMFFQNSRVSATTNDLYSMINLARAEAIRRNTRVTLCGVDAAGRCVSSTGNATPFEQYGWALFEDTTSGASSMDGAKAIVGKLIRVQSAPPAGLLIRSTFGYATFSPMGQVRMEGSIAGGGSVKVCKSTNPATACDTSRNVRCISISGAGAPYVKVPGSDTKAALASAGDGSGQGCE
ncbi:MAG: GspH/FimT family pseudopilin [Pseudomonadota bacterium]